jgi:superfamily I DNA/RNA helicase
VGESHQLIDFKVGSANFGASLLFSLKGATLLSNWTSHLNPQQKQAAEHNHGPMLVLAGAGSGKTTVLVSRTGRLIDESVAKPEQVLLLTFTNKAAREIKERVTSKVGSRAKKIWAGTFHSVGLSIMKAQPEKFSLPKKFGVIDATDARGLVREILKDKFHADKEAFDPERLLAIISLWREGREVPPSFHPADIEMAQLVMPQYLERLQMWGVVDFDGLLLDPLALFERDPEILNMYQDQYQQIMVDEFQDTNKVQMKLVRMLSKKHMNISVVGDDDQSIYGWRGAEVSNILNFPRSFSGCKTVRLETNYRSTPAILNLANAAIANNKDRHGKTLRSYTHDQTETKPEVFCYETDEEEIEEIITQVFHFEREGFLRGEISILFRSNSQGGLLEAGLRQNRIDYHISGGAGFFDRKEIRDVLAYIKSSYAPNDLSLRRILNTPSRGLGQKSFEAIENVAKEKEFHFDQALKACADSELPEKLKNSVSKFLAHLDELRGLLLSPHHPKFEIELPRFMRELGYQDFVLSQYKDRNVGAKKWALVETLGRILDRFYHRAEGGPVAGLKSFLEAMDLRDYDDSEEEKSEQKIHLLTLHASKGLEFPVVILMGLDEGILPHETLGMNIDEERRLFYVGVTRAQKKLVMTRAQKRKRYGQWRMSTPSRFLEELPNELYEDFPAGVRPLADNQRQDMLAQLYAKLGQTSSSN